MEIIKNQHLDIVKDNVYGENDASLTFTDDYAIINDRKAKHDSLAVYAHKVVGICEAYLTSAKMKLAEGTPDTPFILAHKYTMEYLGLEYTMYDLGKTTMLNSADWTDLQQKLEIPPGATLLSVISYFIQQGKTADLPDVYVKEFTVEPAEVTKTVSAAADIKPITRQEKMTFGVIRWDAYMQTSTERSFVSDQVARALSPAHYHKMAPFFSVISDDNTVSFPLETQERFDEEARLAINAGIDYFAYCWFDDSMAYARKQHLASKYKDQIKMCFIFSVSNLIDTTFAAVAEIMKESCYLRFDSRPVVYIYDAFRLDAELRKRFINALRAGGVAEEPYFIGMADMCNPFIVNTLLSNGINAIGAYGCGALAKDEPYEALARRCESTNETKYNFKDVIDVVPLISGGRNSSPRIENPVSWAGDYGGRNAVDPTGEELYTHAANVLNYMLENKDANVPNTVIVYAWNEHDEGAWVCPTIAVDANGTPIVDENGKTLMNASNLNALGRAIAEARAKGL